MHITSGLNWSKSKVGLQTPKRLPRQKSTKGTKKLKTKWKRVVATKVFSNKQYSKLKFKANAREGEQTLQKLYPRKRKTKSTEKKWKAHKLGLQKLEPKVLVFLFSPGREKKLEILCKVGR